MGLRPLGIAGRLALLTMLGAGCLFLVVAGYGYVSSQRALEREFRLRMENLGEATAARIRRIPLGAEAVTRDLATILRFFRPSPQQLPEMMRRLLESHPEVSGLFVGYSRSQRDPALRDFCPTVYRRGEEVVYQDLRGTLDWTVWDWYQLPLQLRKPVWTEPSFSGKGGDGRRVVDYCIPLYDDQWQYLASIGAEIELRWLTDVLSDIPVGDRGYLFLVTPNGTLVSHPNESWIMKETLFTVAEREGNPGKRNSAGRCGTGAGGWRRFRIPGRGRTTCSTTSPSRAWGGPWASCSRRRRCWRA